jgi:hypothetical protein
MPPLLIVAGAVVAVSCRRPARSGDLIDRYRLAACLQAGVAKGVRPPTPGWDQTITLSDGSRVTVRGLHMVPGAGAVSVRYEEKGPEQVAVLPRADIRPSDLRFDSRRDLLYVKARGSAGYVWPETWLHEYDLRQHREVARLLVEPTVLPAECPLPTLSER